MNHKSADNKWNALRLAMQAVRLNGEERRALWKSLQDEGLEIALAALAEIQQERQDVILSEPKPFWVFGDHLIDDPTIKQMEDAMRIPVASRGALLPDAHYGYSIPVGAVLETDHAVIPYAIGPDAGCSMHLSIFNIQENVFQVWGDDMRKALINNTRFGKGASWQDRPAKHKIMDDQRWKGIDKLKDLAARQLGSSGSGNHFVEWGVITTFTSVQGLAAGVYLALLSHSGSRGFGSQIANAYTALAQSMHPTLPDEYKNLAWLPTDHEAGQEYFSLMELAVDYAKSCHEVIHERISNEMSFRAAATLHNPHNYAAKSKGMVVHRKGTMLATKDSLGLIPSNMAGPTYMVMGLGNEQSLDSCSHGAGRSMSRRQAKRDLDRDDLKKQLKKAKVELIGGDLDEAPGAYKDINEVMRAQKTIFKIAGVFNPRIVRMSDDGQSEG